ncbi:MAG: iron-containing alcohol dehydrogenase family protein [Candidatus Bipolaricaulaceae bacterium]
MGSQAAYLSFDLPARVEFGPGRWRGLAGELADEGFRRAALVVTPGRQRSGMLSPVLAELRERGIATTVFAGVPPNPHLQTVESCVQFLKEFAPDVVVGVGGGSPLDTAKAAAACLANGIRDARQLSCGGVRQRATPTVMVPTTAGTGSEVNYWAVIADPATKEKLSIGDPRMAPHLALVDPELTLTLPPALTLWTGLDALTHAVESFMSAAGNWLSDMFCLGAVSLILESLITAVERGRDLRSRGNMALASLLAGAAMENVGLGLVHAMSHQLSGYYDTPHGLANALLLPHVLRFNLPSCQEKVRTLDGLVRGERSFVAWVEGVLVRYGLTKTHVVVRETDLPELARRAGANVNARTNPRPASPAQIEALYRDCLAVAR